MKKQIFFTLCFIGSSSLSIACPTAEIVSKQLAHTLKLNNEMAARIAESIEPNTFQDAFFAPMKVYLKEKGDYCIYLYAFPDGPALFGLRKNLSKK